MRQPPIIVLVDEPVLTVRQPWASAIFVAGKDVENRSWSTEHRGRLWIHAGSYAHRDEADRAAAERGLWVPEEPLPRGVILGCVELVDCVRESESPWAVPDMFHWLLRRPMLLERPVAHEGKPGLWWRRPPRGRLVRARRSPRATAPEVPRR